MTSRTRYKRLNELITALGRAEHNASRESVCGRCKRADTMRVQQAELDLLVYVTHDSFARWVAEKAHAIEKAKVTT